MGRERKLLRARFASAFHSARFPAPRLVAPAPPRPLRSRLPLRRPPGPDLSDHWSYSHRPCRPNPRRLHPSSHSPLEFSSLIQCWFPGSHRRLQAGQNELSPERRLPPFHMGAPPTQPPYLAAYPLGEVRGRVEGQCLESGSNGGTPGPWKW